MFETGSVGLVETQLFCFRFYPFRLTPAGQFPAPNMFLMLNGCDKDLNRVDVSTYKWV